MAPSNQQTEMPRRTNPFQSLIVAIQSHLDGEAAVEESALLEDRTTDARREVDVCVRGELAKQPIIVSSECRDHTRPADVGWVKQMKAKHERLPTNTLVLVSDSGFTREAARIRDGCGIRLLALDDVDPSAPERLFPDVQSLWGKT